METITADNVVDLFMRELDKSDVWSLARAIGLIGAEPGKLTDGQRRSILTARSYATSSKTFSMNSPEARTMPDQCRSCGAPVIFAKTFKSGKQQILDAEPVEDGNILLEDGISRVIPKANLFNPELHDVKRYRDHHASCPAAAAWRKPKKV